MNTDVNYGYWPLKELKEELRKRGARVSGRKRELVERLESYNRNKDFGREEIEREYSMTLPNLSAYKDINTDTIIVKLTFEAVNLFLEPLEKKSDTDAKNLYKDRFLKYIRFAKENEILYIKGECHAEMRKTVTYKIDVSIHRCGYIVECQCECAAGMGPTAHCKHVCALLHALIKFSSDKEIITEQTCTQQLQTFHHCKAYGGSPIKACSLPLANKTIQVNFDPRPEEYRNKVGYTDRFRNVCLNHPNIHSMPISQLYPPANVYAVSLDHDYMPLPHPQYWLEQSNITKISDSEIQEIEKITMGQDKNQLWLREWCKRIQSSNFGRICKATEKTDFHKLAQSLTKSVDLRTPAILHGKKYEQHALRAIEENTGKKCRKCGIFVSDKTPFLAASPDGMMNDDYLIEIKMPLQSQE